MPLVLQFVLPALDLTAGPFVLVPNESLSLDGNTAAGLPFLIATNSTERYQQVYRNSHFSEVPAGGAFVTLVAFRADCMFGNGGTILSNVQVHLSTTSKEPDQLSAVFADNLGADDTIVFGPGRFEVGGGGGGTCPLPMPVDDLIPFGTPFFYNPEKGNLLMQVIVYSGIFRVNPGVFAHDGVNTEGDAVSRVYAPSAFASVATHLDTAGIVTGFTFFPIPSLTNSLTTNGVLLRWPSQPHPFILQWTETLGSTVVWFNYNPNAIVDNSLFRSTVIPYASLKPRQYFRLAWLNGRPIPESVDPSWPSAEASETSIPFSHVRD